MFVVSNRLQRRAVATLVVGDLNAHPQTLDIAVFRTLVPGLTDTWQQLKPDDPGYTSNSPDNAISAAGEESSAFHKAVADICWSFQCGCFKTAVNESHLVLA